jgi:hypothetical protein
MGRRGVISVALVGVLLGGALAGLGDLEDLGARPPTSRVTRWPVSNRIATTRPVVAIAASRDCSTTSLPISRRVRAMAPSLPHSRSRREPRGA